MATDTDGGRLVAVGSWELDPLVGGRSGVFAPDSRLMAVQARGVTRLVDGVAGRVLASLEEPDADATRMSLFTPDGTKLIGLCDGKLKAIRVWDLRLIRRHLKAMGLDWNGPEFPPAGPGGNAAEPPGAPPPEPDKVDVRRGDLAADASAG